MLALADVGAGAVVSLLVAGSAARAVWALALLPGWVLIAKLFGLYDRDQRSIRHLTVDELSVIAAWVAAGIAMLGLLLPLTPAGPVSFVVRGRRMARGHGCGGRAPGGDALALAPHHSAGTDGGARRRRAGPAARRKLELFPDMHLHLVANRSLSPTGSSHDWAASMRRARRWDWIG